MKKISQIEARRLRRRVEDLEQAERFRRSSWARDYPGGVNIAQSTLSDKMDFLPAVIDNSRKLGHAVVVVCDGATLLYYAIPHKGQPV